MDDQDILNLKAEGRSLREIASVLGISHEAVRKRLKNLEAKNQVSTKAKEQKLTLPNKEKEVSTLSDAHKSRSSKETEETVNQVSTSKTPSVSLNESVNPSGNHSRGPLLGMKGVYQGVDSEGGDLLEAIKEFLESKGIELYRMQLEREAYQIKHDRQTIRFYVYRDGPGG